MVKMAVFRLGTVAEVSGEGIITDSVGPDFDIGQVVTRSDG